MVLKKSPNKDIIILGSIIGERCFMQYYRLKMKTLPRVSFAATGRETEEKTESFPNNKCTAVRYVDSGQVEVKIGAGETMVLHSGEFCITPIGIPYSVKISKNSVITSFSFYLDGGTEELVDESEVHFEHSNNFVYVDIESLYIPVAGSLRPSDDAYYQLKQLRGNYDRMGEYVNALVSCNAVQFFLSLAGKYTEEIKDGNDINSKAHLYCDRIDEYIEKNYSQPITMRSIADLLIMHENYISRMYKSIRGITVMRHLRDVRIDKAKKLLLSDKYTVEQISKMVGFSNYKHFIEIFKKVERITPGKYCHSFYGKRLYTYDLPEFIDPEEED